MTDSILQAFAHVDKYHEIYTKKTPNRCANACISCMVSLLVLFSFLDQRCRLVKRLDQLLGLLLEGFFLILVH
jgi:hypothetical protein